MSASPVVGYRSALPRLDVHTDVGDLYPVFMLAKQALYQLICLPNLNIFPFFLSVLCILLLLCEGQSSPFTLPETVSCHPLSVHVFSLLHKPSSLACKPLRSLAFCPLLSPQECWHHRHTPPCPAFRGFCGVELRPCGLNS